MMKTAIYARVSTKDGRQDAENQLKQLRTFAATQGWEIVHEYVDKASGKRGDRDHFQKMFTAASKREFDFLLFWSLDRLSREGTVKTLNHLQGSRLWCLLSVVHGAVSGQHRHLQGGSHWHPGGRSQARAGQAE